MARSFDSRQKCIEGPADRGRAMTMWPAASRTCDRGLSAPGVCYGPAMTSVGSVGVESSARIARMLGGLASITSFLGHDANPAAPERFADAPQLRGPADLVLEAGDLADLHERLDELVLQLDDYLKSPSKARP